MKNYVTILITFLALAVTGCGNAQKEEGYKNITVTEFKNLDFEYQLVDVRTPEEFAEGAIDGAKNINFYSPEFLEEMNKLDKEKPVVLYCRSGGRSANASNDLIKAGFKKVYNVEGGYIAYSNQ